MLKENALNSFISEVNNAHQQFCIWVYANNEFAKRQKEWNRIAEPEKIFKSGKFSRDKGCKYKNFWTVIIPSLQHSWILSLARLFDPAYHSYDNKKEKPRLSLNYILESLDDHRLVESIRESIKKCDATIKSIRTHRHNFLAHNDINFVNTEIKAGVEILFEELGEAISNIKKSCKSRLVNCNSINLGDNIELSRCSVNEIFERL